MKKTLSFFVLISILINIICSTIVYGAGNIPVTAFTIKVNSGNAISGDVSVNPGDIIKILISGENRSGTSMNNVETEFSFSNTIDFSYDNPGQTSSYVWWSLVNQNISTSVFNPPVLNKAPITSLSNAGDVIDLYYTNFKFSDNAKNYITTIGAKFLADGYIGSELTRNIYVNVKPHIIDYYFEKADGSQTTNQVQGAQAESINLVLKVKDYNGCINLNGGNVTSNLSQLGLSSSETLTYYSCDIDGKTAIFKKEGITTNSATGTYNFPYTNFNATDIDGNQNNANDTKFGSEDKKTDLSLTVVPASAPNIMLLSLNGEYIGGPDKLSYVLSFSGSQAGSGKISLGSDGSCNGGTTLYDWFDYNISNTQIDKTINSQDLQVGNNTIYACIKNSGGNIGSLNLNIIKDITSPIISNVIVSPGSVITNDSSLSFQCSENGYYRVEVGGNGIPGNGTLVKDWTTSIPSTNYTTSILNGSLSLGTNTLYGYCKDNASNLSYKTGSVIKVPPTPSMGTITSFSDTDIDYNGLDGRDITTNWNLTQEIIDATNFESYRIYLLPSNVSFNSGSQNYVKLITNKNTTTWTGDSTLTKDSLNQNLTSGGSYKVCISIMGTSGQLGTESCSSQATLTSDIVQNAKILSAKFTSNTNLEITTDTTLDTNLSNHSGTLISYVYNSSTLNPTSIASINGSKINLTIPALNNIGAIGSNIIMLTGALRSDGGGYNNYFSSGGLSITDGQNPTVSGFVNNTASVYNNFFSGSIDVGFTFAENMKSGGSTKITFDRTSGNVSSQKIYNITDNSKLISGSHNQNLDLVSIGLVSGTTYDMRLLGQDLAGNSVTSNAVSIKFDNSGPSQVTLVDAENTSSQTPTLSWSTSTDDSGNGSGVKEYIIKIFNSVDCSGSVVQTLTGTTTSKVTNLLNNGTYSWNVYALDNMSNIGTISGCDSFMIDTTVPTISNQKIIDINNNSTSFTKSGNTIEVTADLTNTDITKIKADLSALTGDVSHTGVVCNSPVSGVSCSYIGGKVTYSFIVGFAGVVSELVRQVKLIVSNISQINVIEKLASITIDNTQPTIGTISSPTSQTYGGNNLNITWNGITDSNLNYIKLEYSSNGGANYNLIHTGSNVSPYVWDISALTTGNNYKVRITAIDKSGNESQTESQIFSLDKSNPTIISGSIISPSAGIYIKGNNTYDITWNSGNITDNETLPINPITLEYSTNNGTNWNIISSTIPNTGTYTWNVPNTSSTQIKLRMKVKDNVGNESSYETTSSFVIDSQNPTFSITTGTPPNGAYINANGFDVIGTAGDNIKIDKIYYSFKRNSNNTYWDENSYTGVLTWNLLQDNIDSLSYNLNELIVPTIVNGENYDLTLKVLDKAGNEISSVPRQYVADTINPTLNITNSNNSYFSGSINISGTSSDSGAGISSVKISIKKGTDYWNGSSWVGSEQLLVTNTSNNYTNWNYEFLPSLLENDGENYEVIVTSYDKSYKVNNSFSGSLNIILDKIGPVIENDIFNFTPSGFYAGGSSFEITWNPAKITSSGASFSHVKLEYNDDGVFSTITGSTLNDGSYTFNLPSLDDNITIIISAYDNIGNISNTIASNSISIDSTPPIISSVETMDMTANGQIDALKVVMSESINDSTITLGNFNISGVGIPTSWETGNSSNDDTFILKFSDFGDTSSTPNLSYTKGTLTDGAGKFLESVSNISSIDTANPRILNGEIFANNSGIFNKIDVYFSENISSSTDIGAFSLNNGLTISSVSTSLNKATLNLNLGSVGTDASGYTLDFTSNSNWKDSSNNQAGSLGTPINLIDKAKPVLIGASLNATNYIADEVILNFSESLSGTLSGFNTNTGTLSSPNLVSDEIIFNFSGVSGTSPDLNISYVPGNLEDNHGNILDSFSNIIVVEKISPKLEIAKTLDQNGNGKIDGVLLGFSENLNGNLSDILVGVNGYIIDNYTNSGSQNVIVGLQEKSTFDTDATPSVNIVSNNALKDLNNNTLLSQTITSIDNVGPVIIGARYEPSTHKVFVNFSENINNSDFLSSSFVLQNAGSYSIVGVDSIEKSITLSGEDIDYSLSSISLVINVLRDNLGNKQSMVNFVSITAPVVINEIMVSTDINNNYVELHNLSNDTISLSGWTIAGIIIPNVAISANGYYLISKSTSGTSNINVNPDLVDNIVFTGSELVLNNGTIDIDKASLNTGLGDISIPASIERKSPVSNGLLSNSWYKALVSTGFDNGVPLGTPGSANVFDVISPTLSSNLTGSLLLPIGYYNLVYTYSDNIFINTGSLSFSLEKWNGSSFVASSGYNTGTINNNNVNFNISGLDYGRYKTIFSISDSAGNISIDTKEFYVDNFSFTISTGSLNLGILEPNNLKLANDLVEIEVKTIGAGFNLVHDYSTNNLGDYNGSLGYGACEGVSCSILENYKNKTIVNQSGELQSSGALKIYNYKIKYGSIINELKEAGIYQVNNEYTVEVNY